MAACIARTLFLSYVQSHSSITFDFMLFDNGEVAPKWYTSLPTRLLREPFWCDNLFPVYPRKSWTVTKVEGDAGVPVAEIPVEGILPSWNFSELSVPARFLGYGTFFFTYRLQLLASKIFPLFRTASTYVTVPSIPDTFSCILLLSALCWC